MMTIRGEAIVEAFSRLDRRRFLQLASAAGGGLLFGGRTMEAGASWLQQAATEFPSRAIVIGINDYENVRQLNNPVRDACRFTDWLVTQAGVLPENVILLTSPNPPLFPTVNGVQLELANNASILRAVQQVPLAAGAEERLYFYCSGHGVAFQPRGLAGSIDEQDAIVPCDYKGDATVKPVSIPWILRYLAASNFVEQFFFFDACRNVQSMIDPDTGLVPPALPANRPAPFQYVLFATAPGRITLDITGMFTDVLLDALNTGKGTSKLFDPVKRKYLIRWDALERFLRDHFAENPVVLGEANGEEILLEPEKRVFPGEWSAAYPYLVALSELAVGKKKLSVEVLPLTIRPKARVTITSSADNVRVVTRASVPEASGTLYEVELLPQHYSVLVEAEGAFPEVRPVELNEDTILPSVTLQSEQPLADADVPAEEPISEPLPAPSPSSPPPPTVNPARSYISSSNDFISSSGGGGSINITAPDVLAPVELVDEAGSPLPGASGGWSSGIGSLRVGGLRPGVYRARFYSNGGRVIERIVPLLSDAKKSVKFPKTHTATSKIASAVEAAVGRELPIPMSTSSDSEDELGASGPAAYLAQAARVADGDPAWAALLAKSLGLKQFPDDGGGIRIILGVGLDSLMPDDSALEQVTLRIGPLDGNEIPVVRPAPCDVEGVAVFTLPTINGPYRMRFERPGELAEFALVVLPGRISELIVEQLSGGRIRISQFAPEAHPERPLDPEIVFKIDRLQRDLQGGASRAVPALLGELKAADIVEPVAIAISAYFESLAGRREQLAEAATLLVNKFPDMPDGHVAQARVLESAGDREGAKLAYAEALNRGLPVLASFLTFLYDGAMRYELSHGRVTMLKVAAERQIPGLLWSAWRPG